MGVATPLTSGLILAGAGECAVMNEGGVNGLVTNFGLIHAYGSDMAGILATARIDFTFSGNRQTALAGSSAEVVNHGTVLASGDGVRVEVQGDASVTNDGMISGETAGIRDIDMDARDGSGLAEIVRRFRSRAISRAPRSRSTGRSSPEPERRSTPERQTMWSRFRTAPA